MTFFSTFNNSVKFTVVFDYFKNQIFKVMTILGNELGCFAVGCPIVFASQLTRKNVFDMEFFLKSPLLFVTFLFQP